MINNNFNYYLPTKIIYGNNSSSKIKDFIEKNEKILLLTSKSFLQKDIIKNLSSKNTIIISNIKSHPTFEDMNLICDGLKDIKINKIIAIGGGSVMDGAKFISAFYNFKYFSTLHDVIKNKKQLVDSFGFIPIICVPTTSGTSSEITPWATIWDNKEKKKYSLHFKELFSQIAIYDPSLTLSLPKDLTIQTSLDALSHSLESIWNKNANPISINNAIKSAKLIIKYLPLLVNDLENISYRDKIMQGSMFAGLAFSNTQTALAHAISYYITSNKGIPHGLSCSFTLPLLIDNIIGKYEFTDEALMEIFNELSSKKLRTLYEELHISTNFIDYNIDKNDINNIKLSLKNNQRANNSLVEF